MPIATQTQGKATLQRAIESR